MVRFVAAVLVAISLGPIAQAQIPVSAAAPVSFAVRVSGVAEGPDDPHTELNRTVYLALRDEFVGRGFPATGPGMRLHVRAERMPSASGATVILSIVEGHTLREETVAAGAANEIWYAGRTLPADLQEGKFVREYMTREVLENLVNVDRIKVLVFEEAELDREIAGFVDAVEARVNCQNPEGCM